MAHQHSGKKQDRCGLCDLGFFLFFPPSFQYFLVPHGNFGSPYLGKTQQLQERHYPSLPVCAVFLVSKQWYGCQCLGFLRCAQMLMHVIERGGGGEGGGCTDTVRKSAWKLTLGERSLASPGT